MDNQETPDFSAQEHIQRVIDTVCAIILRIKSNTRLDKSKEPCLYIRQPKGATT